MRLPSFRSRNNTEGPGKSNDTIFDEAIELAQLRLQQCIADLQDRICTPKQALDRGGPPSPDEIQKAVA